jgi:hypothetical protein
MARAGPVSALFCGLGQAAAHPRRWQVRDFPYYRAPPPHGKSSRNRVRVITVPQRYPERAEECVRLANLAKDEMIRAELLRLRQTYLSIAARIKAGLPDSGGPSPNNAN